MSVIVRIWDCWNCGNKWIAKVELGPTPNISGEKTVYCPKCNQRGSCGSPHKVIEIRGDQLVCKDRYSIDSIENVYPTLIDSNQKKGGN
jgi:hypothetical protein